MRSCLSGTPARASAARKPLRLRPASEGFCEAAEEDCPTAGELTTVTIAIVGLRAIGARALSNASSAGIKDGKTPLAG
jgi:hypothetical protein